MTSISPAPKKGAWSQAVERGHPDPHILHMGFKLDGE